MAWYFVPRVVEWKRMMTSASNSRQALRWRDGRVTGVNGEAGVEGSAASRTMPLWTAERLTFLRAKDTL